MSELKEIGIRWEENGELHFSHVYLKSEADKVIAHHKHKRCLVMARWCMTEYENSFERILAVRDMRLEPSDELTFHLSFFKRWHNLWLELAETFKEAK